MAYTVDRYLERGVQLSYARADAFLTAEVPDFLSAATVHRSRTGCNRQRRGDGYVLQVSRFWDGKMVPFEEARLHILTPAVKYAATAFEGIKSGPGTRSVSSSFYSAAEIIWLVCSPYSRLA